MQHREGHFQGYQKIELYYQSWLPDNKPAALILCVHGLAEHSGRYVNLANFCLSKGYGLYCYDQRGHGKSPGRKGYIENFTDLLKDLDIFVDKVKNLHPDLKIFLLGHSMGGTVATMYAILNQYKIQGLILSGALLRLPNKTPSGLVRLARIISGIFPGAGLYTLEAEAISRDKNIVNAYITDPLVYRGKICARTGVELVRTIMNIERRIPELNLPLLAMHGTADRLADVTGSQMLIQKATSSDKKLILYRDLYHEIFNEPEKEKVFEDLDHWLRLHL